MIWCKVLEVLDEYHGDIFMPVIVSEHEFFKIKRAML